MTIELNCVSTIFPPKNKPFWTFIIPPPPIFVCFVVTSLDFKYSLFEEGKKVTLHTRLTKLRKFQEPQVPSPHETWGSNYFRRETLQPTQLPVQCPGKQILWVVIHVGMSFLDDAIVLESPRVLGSNSTDSLGLLIYSWVQLLKTVLWCLSWSEQTFAQWYHFFHCHFILL